MLARKSTNPNNLFNIAEKEESVTLRYRLIFELKNPKEEAKMRKTLFKDCPNLKKPRIQAPLNTKPTIPQWNAQLANETSSTSSAKT